MPRYRDEDDDGYRDLPGRRRAVVHHHHHGGGRSPGVAALLEFLPGLLAATFGIGHIYAGNVALGLCAMFGYWLMFAVNVALCFVLVGFVTMPLCWLVMIVGSPIAAAAACRR